MTDHKLSLRLIAKTLKMFCMRWFILHKAIAPGSPDLTERVRDTASLTFTQR